MIPTVSPYSPCGHAALTQLINCLPLSILLLTADPSSLPLSLQGSTLQRLAATSRLGFASGPCCAVLEACQVILLWAKQAWEARICGKGKAKDD